MNEPWMPFYGRDFYDSGFVRRLSRQHRADYLELLWCQWCDGSLPADPEDVRATLRLSATEFASSWRRLADRFPIAVDGQRRNPRLETLRAERDGFVESKRNAGRKGAAARWQTHGTTDGTGHGKGDGKPMAQAMAKVWPASASASAEENPSPGSVDATTLRSWTGGAGTEPPEAPPPPGTERRARPEPSDFASQPEPPSTLAADEIAYLRSLPGQENAGMRRSRAVR